jgi:hypothetical protein
MTTSPCAVFQKSVLRAKAWWLAATNRWRTATTSVARPGLSSAVVSEDEKKQTASSQTAFLRPLVSLFTLYETLHP